MYWHVFDLSRFVLDPLVMLPLSIVTTVCMWIEELHFERVINNSKKNTIIINHNQLTQWQNMIINNDKIIIINNYIIILHIIISYEKNIEMDDEMWYD